MQSSVEFLTPYQLHKRWSGAISPKTLANWRAKNIGPRWQKIGGRVVYPIGAVLEYEQAGLQGTLRGVVAVAVGALLSWILRLPPSVVDLMLT